MESLQQTAQRMLGQVLDGQPLSLGKVRFAWSIVAGPAMSRATRVDWNDRGVLHVTASTAAWRHEVERARPLLAVRLKQMLGAGAIRSFSISD